MKKLSTLKNRILVAAMTAKVAAMPIIANAAEAAGASENTVVKAAMDVVDIIITLFALFGVYIAVPAGFRIIVAIKDKTGEDMHAQSISLIVGLALIAFKIFMWPTLSAFITAAI